MNFEEELRHFCEGEVRSDAISRKAYSVDASIYEIEPIAIVLPKSKQDIFHAVRIARQHHVAIIPRGAATGITGGCLGSGLIIDCSKYLNRVLHIDYEKKYALCEPGVVQDQLNQLLAPEGLRLGPDTSTGNRATIGGMVANNAAGARSLHYGRMVDAIIEVELLLANGEIVRFGPLGEDQVADKCNERSAEGYIYREAWRIRQQYREQIAQHFPKIPRRVSGYNLDELIKPGSLNLAKLIVGSEGTLGVITEIKVQLAERPKATGISIVYFHDLLTSMQAVPYFLSFKPMAMELIDKHIIEMGRSSPSMQGKLEWLHGDPEALLMLEFEGASREEVDSKMALFEEAVIKEKIGDGCAQLVAPLHQEYVWGLRKAGLGLLLSKRSYNRAIAFIEDVSVAPQNLAPFMQQLIACLKQHGKDAGIYGHVGSGCMHLRPYMDLRNQNEVEMIQKIMLEVSDLLLAHGGSMSGEHGDGLTRSWLNKKMFGDTVYHAFIELKKAFDPSNLMNPGKIVHPHHVLDHLRLNPQIAKQRNQIDTILDFSKEGGFELAVDLCNGNGQCRKKEGVMCPSFQATGDEYDTTRARAQALRAVVNGRLKVEDLASQGVHDVLDLCLQCKGCKTECPSQVDMAKMKAEVLFHYQKKHGFSLRNRLFAHMGMIYRHAIRFPKFSNWVQSSSLMKWLFNCIGISTERPFPQLTPLSFSKWYQKHLASGDRGEQSKKVVLFNDTYTEFHHPEIGKAAVKILESLGYNVVVPEWSCCGRPHLSKGMLPDAKKMAERVVDMLYPYAAKGIEIIGLEPSCILTMRDDYPSLLGSAHPKVNCVVNHCMTFAQFLDRLREKEQLSLTFTEKSSVTKVKVHGHCYEKAVIGTGSMLRILRMVPHFQVEEIPTGCCGMAGSFGYEKEHYDLSMKIGELKLLPTVRAADPETVIVANGTSCRGQIQHGTNKQACHFVNLLADQISAL